MRELAPSLHMQAPSTRTISQATEHSMTRAFSTISTVQLSSVIGGQAAGQTPKTPTPKKGKIGDDNKKEEKEDKSKEAKKLDPNFKFGEMSKADIIKLLQKK